VAAFHAPLYATALALVVEKVDTLSIIRH